MASIINATTTAGVTVQGDNSGSLQLATNNGTTALTIDTSQRAAFVAGTYGLPAITTTGDTNTGIFFPAADTIATSTAGSERMRIDSSGDIFAGGTTINGATGSIYSKTNAKVFVQWVGSSGTINQSKNVSSVTRNSTGDYTVAFSFTFSTNYAIVLGGSRNNGATDAFSMNYYSQTASSVRVNTSLPAINFIDAYTADLVIFA